MRATFRDWQLQRLAQINQELAELRSLRALWRAWYRMNRPAPTPRRKKGGRRGG